MTNNSISTGVSTEDNRPEFAGQFAALANYYSWRRLTAISAAARKIPKP